MPVTNSVQPPKIAYSKNNIIIELASDDYTVTPGSKSITIISPTGFIGATATITLKWSKATVVMTATDAPDESGNTFIYGDGNAAHIAAMVPYFQANYYIDRDFIVSSTATALVLTAREKGTAFNLSITVSWALVVNTAGTNFLIKTNFKHFLQIWLNVAGNYVNIYERLLELNQPYTGVTTKDIAEILHPYLVPGFANNKGSDKPALTGAGWQACNKTVLEYYFKYAQSFGERPLVKALKKSTNAFVNIGSLDIKTAADQSLITFLRPDAGDDSKTLCLRHGSRLKKIQPEQPEHLYWLNLTETTVDVRVKFTLFYAEGGSGTFYSALQNSAPYSKYTIPVGYLQAGVDTHLPVGKTCARYVATIVDDADDPLSVPYTYEMDVYREWPRYIIFRNSLGGFQTIYTWGKGQTETTRSKTDFNSQVTDAEAAATGRAQEINIKIQEKIVVFTGYTTDRDIKILKDLFAAEEKYLVTGNKYVPIGISSDSLKEAQDGNNLNGASFEFYPKYDEVAYTDDPTQADLTASITIPNLYPIYCGAVNAIPSTEAEVLIALSAQPYASSLSFETGITRRHFVYIIQADKTILSVTDEDAILGSDLTLLFPHRNTISIAGINYKVYGMITGGPYSPSHTLTFINS